MFIQRIHSTIFWAHFEFNIKSFLLTALAHQLMFAHFTNCWGKYAYFILKKNANIFIHSLYILENTVIYSIPVIGR